MAANTKNLKKGNPATQFKAGREQAETAKKGGKASGEARRKTAGVKKFVQAILDGDYTYDGKTATGAELIARKLMQKALDDDDKDQLAAIKYINSLTGEDRTEEEIEKIKAETNLINKKIEIASAEQWSGCSTIGGE